jgi:peptidoglycan/LPS O-acetylase OafA/YrhL
MPLVDVASALLVPAVVAVPRSLVARGCALGPLAWCGRISYSLYLVHPVVLVVCVIDHQWLGPWRAIGASFLIAAALHRFVEEPIRRGNPFRLRRRRDAPAPAPA